MIYHLLSIAVFLLFVAAFTGFILFGCVLVDAVAIWWEERRG